MKSPLLDWRDRDAYPSPEAYRSVNMGIHGAGEDHDEAERESPRANESCLWAWQFLRRNTAYQTDFDVYGRTSALHIAITYDLSVLIPYAVEIPQHIPFTAYTNTVAFTSNRKLNTTSLQLKPHEVAIVFDMRLPIVEQQKLVQREISKARLRRKGADERSASKGKDPIGKSKEIRGRKNVVALSRYLRVIDARAAGVGMKVIAEQLIADGAYNETAGYKLYPGQSQVERDWTIAKELMDTGYRRLAYS